MLLEPFLVSLRKWSDNYSGVKAIIDKPADAIELGLAFVPEDRAGHGIFSTLSVEHNLTATIPDKIAPKGIISRKLEKTFLVKLLMTYQFGLHYCANQLLSYLAAINRNYPCALAFNRT